MRGADQGEGQDMKQRTRIQCIKARTYPSYIRRDRMQKAWATARQAWRSMMQAMREAYAKGREEMQ
jgi:hypothetical protein